MIRRSELAGGEKQTAPPTKYRRAFDANLKEDMAQYQRITQIIWTIGILILCIVSISSASAPGQPEQSRTSIVWAPPPSLIPEDLNLRPSVRKEILTKLRVAGLEIVLEHTPIREAQQRFGGRLGHSGDAGDSLTWLCLRGSDRQGHWALWLESGEIDNGTISGFRWQQIDVAEEFSSACPVLNQTDSRIELPALIGLGTPEASVFRALGQPTKRQDDTFVYYHSHGVSIKGVPYTVSNDLAIQIRRGVVHAIQADRSTVS